jgi:hypothetical protein
MSVPGARATTSAVDVDVYVERIRAFHGERYEVATESTLTHRGRGYPILSVRSRAPADKTLLVLAGVHGDEQAGLLAVPALLEAHACGRVRLVVITPVNPVGAARRSRLGSGGHDINRDFIRFRTPEARVVRDVFTREKPDFVISLHEGPQRGTFMFANRFVDQALARALCEDLSRGGTTLASKDYFGLRLDPPGLSASFAAGRAITKVWAVAFRLQATIAYSEDREIPEIVLESSSRTVDEAARVRPHVDLVAAVTRRIA